MTLAFDYTKIKLADNEQLDSTLNLNRLLSEK